ncbi:hypothetical protein LT85_1602 [Collimonas arenae]|uniref:Uncharacterized protein n=1 Tax=Collimonas arenae TaxID=279058 RepID=A0A0A1FAJ9_9BURK|nr:hypothetical protein LT85_1602 [Collimonas arenae]
MLPVVGVDSAATGCDLLRAYYVQKASSEGSNLSPVLRGGRSDKI